MAGASSIKLFEFNQKYCQTIGIRLPKPNRKSQFPSNAKNVFYVASWVQFSIALVAYLLLDAKHNVEYGIAFYTLISIIESMVAYFITLWKLEDISKFTKTCEAFIERSKLEWSLIDRTIEENYLFSFAITIGSEKLAYKGLNAKIEKICEWFVHAILCTFIAVVLFPLLYTGVCYYLLDLGAKSFYLFPPTEFV